MTDAERAIGYTFKDKNLLKRALTLASANRDDNNQLLEFFGDAVLEFIVSERIFDEGSTEGALTERRKSLVADSALTPVSERLGLDGFLIRGKHDVNNKKAVPSAYEAIVAAIYLDGGMDEARKFVLSTLDFSSSKASQSVNYKGMLQELLQSSGQSLPDYVSKKSGSPQRPYFTVSIKVFNKTFTVRADSVKGENGGEQLAARKALGYYNSQYGQKL